MKTRFALRTSQYVALLIIVVLGAGIYANTLSVPYYLDDQRNITENYHIRLSSLSYSEIKEAAFESPSPSRPVANLSFALNYYFHRYNLAGFHLTNIAIHLLAGAFLFLFLLNTLSAPVLKTRYENPLLIAFFGALLWLVHPVQIQSVTYLVQRMNSLAAMFYILSFWLYTEGRLAGKAKRARFWLAGSLLAAILAMGSKEVAITLPFFIMLYEGYFFRDMETAWIKQHVLSLAAAFLIVLSLALVFLGPSPIENIVYPYDYRDFTMGQRLLTELRVLVFYLGLLIYPSPSRLNLEHDFSLSYSFVEPISTLFSLAAILLLIGLAIYYARRFRLVSFAILWFFGNLVIESTVLPLEIIFEHRLYLPSMILCLCPVLLLFGFIRNRGLAVAAILFVVVIFSAWTHERNSLWQNPVAFWEDASRKSPNKARVFNSLGIAYQDKGLSALAESAIRQAMKIKPDFVKAHLNLGNIYLSRGLYDQAIAEYQSASSLSPGYADARANLGNAYLKKGMHAEAIDSYLEAISIRPEDVRARVNLGSVYSMAGKTGEAITEFQQALKYEAENPDIYFNLGLAYLDEGRRNKAVEMFKKVLSLNPDDVPAQERLSELLTK